MTALKNLFRRQATALTKTVLGLALLTGFGLANHSHAALSPVGIGLFPPLQFPFEDTAIVGVRANLLWGKHRNVSGFDVGVLMNTTTINFSGLLQVAGLINHNKGSTGILGAQIGGLANINKNKARIYGIQASAGVNYSGAESTLVGLAIAPIANHAPHSKIVGAQIGLYNKARSVYGFQIGLINSAENLHGLQIGLINFHANGLFAVCPAINFGF
jgi:hypothetical protein